MFPELSMERVFRRELDSLPLPDERLWVSNRRATRPLGVVLSLAGAALLLGLVAVGVVRDRSGAATQPSGAVATCEPPGFGANGRCTSLVPNLFLNFWFHYSLTLPGGWQEVVMPAGAEPFVRDQPSGDPSLTAPFLLDRHVFTARPVQNTVAPPGTLAPAWDLDVQVWDRQGRTAVEWSRAFPCDAPVATFGETNCVRSEETIRGTTVSVTTVMSFRWHVTSYYIERGDQMMIVRYLSSETDQPPAGVTDETLRGIVHSIGLD